jgi:hypothetical protein
VSTEEIEELLLAWMHPVLEHNGYPMRFRFLFLKQKLRLEITCQPSAAISGFNDKMPKKTAKRTCNDCAIELDDYRRAYLGTAWIPPGSNMIEIIK